MHTPGRWIWRSFMWRSRLFSRTLRLAHRLNSLSRSIWVASLCQRNWIISMLKLIVLATPQTIDFLFHFRMWNVTDIYLAFWRTLLILNVVAKLRVDSSVVVCSTFPIINLHDAVVARVDWTKVADSVQSLRLLFVEGRKMLRISWLLHISIVIVTNNALSLNLNGEFVEEGPVGSLLIWRMLIIYLSAQPLFTLAPILLWGALILSSLAITLGCDLIGWNHLLPFLIILEFLFGRCRFIDFKCLTAKW